jgi:hypothetical protein
MVSHSASGITLAYPPEWDVQKFGRYCRRIGPGVLISNVQGHRLRNVPILNGCTDQWDFAGLPSRYVVVDVSLFSRPPSGRDERDTPLPLQLAGFQRHPHGYRFERIRHDGNDYAVRVWSGPASSREDEDAVAR